MIGSFRMAKGKVVICPYCGETQPAGESCRACGGLFEPLSRQATHNAMGPWFIRDPQRPFQPGASYATLVRMIERGQINRLSIVRGPTTKQFWTIAKRVPGIAHLLGYCHACDAPVDPADHGCHVCGARFGAYLDRNYMGLPEIQPLPWEEGPGDEAPETSALSTTPPDSTPGFEPAEAMPPGGRAGHGGRISSFATDEELLGPAGQGDRAWTGGPPVSGAAETSPQSAPPPGATEPNRPAPTPAAATETARASSPATAGPGDDTELRMARRRARRLQQTNGRLWLAVLAVLVINVLLLAVLAFSGRSGAQPDRSSEPEPAQKTPATPPPSTSANDAPSTASQQEVNDARPTDDGEQRDQAGDAEQKPSSAEPVDSGYATALADADALIEAAQDEQRPLADRIADYESAIELLKKVHTEAPEDAKPADLEQRIEQAERDLERLRLREFFP